MSFTIEDAFLFTKEIYKLKLVAGKAGIHRQISWVHMIEDTTIINQFWGNELVVTTCLGFENEEKLYHLVSLLDEHKSSGIIVNVGKYMNTIPTKVVEFCESHELPLITVPWEIYLADLIKDFCIRTFSSQKENQKSIRVLSHLFKNRLWNDIAQEQLSSLFFSKKGSALLFYISFPIESNFDYMEEHKILFQIQTKLDLESYLNILFSFDTAFIFLLYGFDESMQNEIKETILEYIKVHLNKSKYYIGCSNVFHKAENILQEFDNSKAANLISIKQNTIFTDYANSGLEKLWFSYPDKDNIYKLVLKYLAPIMEYDKEHNSNYLETFESFLKHNGSIKAVASELYTHRNTIQYRMTKIKELLNDDLESNTNRCDYLLAFQLKDYYALYKKIEIL